MDKIIDLLNNIDKLGEKLPKLDSVMEWSVKLTALAVKIGPLCILILGLIHMLIPPREANHKAGYRTFFGMGSPMAWRFTQRVSGAIMTVLGLILTLTASGAAKSFPEMDPMDMIDKAFSLVKGQVICSLAVFVFMIVLTALLFNFKGNLRFKSMANLGIMKLLTCDLRKTLRIMKRGERPTFPSEEEAEDIPQEEEEDLPEEGEEAPVEYERQGEQTITADDIVIEYQ